MSLIVRSMPEELWVYIFSYTDVQTRNASSLSCKIFARVMREFVRSVYLPSDDRHLQKFLSRFPPHVKRIFFGSWSCKRVAALLSEPEVQKVEMLSLVALNGLEEEDLLSKAILKLTSLRILKIVSSNNVGVCIHPSLHLRSLILENCYPLRIALFPPSLEHLSIHDVPKSGLPTLTNLSKLQLLRDEQNLYPEYQGTRYTSKTLASGDLKTIESLFNQGADPNTAPLPILGDHARLALFIKNGANLRIQDLEDAINKPCFACVSLLLNGGAPCNDVNRQGNTPLHQAVQQSLSNIAHLLIRNGAYVRATNAKYETPLHAAASNGDTACGALLVSHGADLNARAIHKWSPLHKAAENGQGDFANFLLEKGADIHARDDMRATPLHRAALKGHVSVARLLVSKGASMDAVDKKNSTPLHVAIQHGHVACATFLVNQGANIKALNLENMTPLHYTYHSKDDTLPLLLLSKGADMHAKNAKGETSLHLSVAYGSRTRVSLMLDQGADIHAQNHLNETVLHYLVRRDSVHFKRPLLELLVERGANINATNHEGKTPLQIARDKKLKCLPYLLHVKTALEKVDAVGRTSLHLAAAQGDQTQVRLLLSRGSPIDAIDHFHETPLHLAATEGRDECVALLLEKGANLQSKNVMDLTPLEVAMLHQKEKCIELLTKEERRISQTKRKFINPMVK